MIIVNIVDGVVHASTFLAKATCVVVGVAVAPLVSLVALPIFAAKAAYAEFQLRKLPTQHSNEMYGRIQSQDYTHWDGKATTKKTKWLAKTSEALHDHRHMKDDFPKNPAEDCTFKTKEDLEWLKNEYILLKRNDHLKIVRHASKALIPIAGVIWAILSEVGEYDFAGKTNPKWSNKDALDFHIKNLSKKLNVGNQ